MRRNMKMQPQIIVGMANHGVTATIMTTTVIDISPMIIISNIHIDNIKSTILISLANLIKNENIYIYNFILNN